MKTAVKIITAITFSLLIVGLPLRHREDDWSILFSLGMLLLAFVWTPVFLFYSYERKQRRKERRRRREKEDQ